jgi:hypothetical protein
MSLQEAVKYVAGAYGLIILVLITAYILTAHRTAVLTRELRCLREAVERRLTRERE